MKKVWCLLLALLLTGCAAPAQEAPELRGSMTVHYLPGGALVQCNSENLLVDCGGEITAETLKNYGVERLAAVVLTGAGRDSGLEALLETFPAEVYRPGEAEREFYLDCGAVKTAASGAVSVTFGEDRFLFQGAASMSGENARVLWLAEGVSPSGETEYLLVDGKADKALKEQYNVLDSDGFGPVTVQTEGKGVTVSITLFTSDSVAS